MILLLSDGVLDFLQLLVICEGSSQRTKLQEALILRVDSASAKLSISSMLLFQCLIEIGDQRVLESLLLSNLPMRTFIYAPISLEGLDWANCMHRKAHKPFYPDKGNSSKTLCTCHRMSVLGCPSFF